MTMHRRVRLSEADVVSRVRRFLRERLAEGMIRSRMPLELSAWTTAEPVRFDEAVDKPFEPVSIGEPWGAPWTTTWFRMQGAAPAADPATRVELDIDLGFIADQVGFQAEALAYARDGRVLKAINPRSRWLPRPEDGAVDVFIEAAGNPVILHAVDDDFSFAPTPLGDPGTAGGDPQYRLSTADVVAVDLEVEALIAELEVLVDLLPLLPSHSARRAQLTVALEEAVDLIDPGAPRRTALAARARLAPVLAVRTGDGAHRISAVGHAHIDSAWLWPFRETRRKVARTVANVLERMDADPELVYAMSSAQQFAWVKEDHPALFERLRARVREGRFIPVGGMWVEADAVMPSGESFVRQLLLGQRWFEAEFGALCTVGWLPDSFGYSGALPQLLRGAGLTSFVTQKISWNRTNRFPHHLFAWEGIDGSRIVTHFPSADMYNSSMTPREVLHAERNLQDKDLHNASILPFGYGDGGGGPTREMSTRARILRDLDGSPRIEIAGPERFFADVPESAELPVWFGELYLESHRGVSTSQARTKAAHRRLERSLKAAELWSATATIRGGAPYPADELRECWQELLLMEFHDVLPGSSIAWVHQEAERRLTVAADRADALIGAASTMLTGSHLRDGRASGAVTGGSARAAGSLTRARAATVQREKDGYRLQNDRITVVLDARGLITELIDERNDRQLIPTGAAGNGLLVHTDAPTRWDAWDLDPGIDGSGTTLDQVESIYERSFDDGAVAVVVDRRYGASTFEQEIRIGPGSAAVDLTVTVDWHERDRLLQLEFPVAIAATSWQAETQFGFTERPTVRNTSWDEARYEAAAHRWVRVAEPGYGVALLNDRTYGHSARRVTDEAGSPALRLRASLLKASGFPDPRADQGPHTFRFSLLLDVDEGETTRAAAALASAISGVGAAPEAALMSSSHPRVLLDTVKLAEDGSGDVVARLYEAGGSQARTRLVIDFPFSRLTEVDLLERPIEIEVDPDALLFRPFQVRTIRVTPSVSEAGDPA